MKFLHLSDIHFLREYPKAEKGYNAIFIDKSFNSAKKGFNYGRFK